MCCLCLFFDKTKSLGKNPLKICKTVRNEEANVRLWERQLNLLTHDETVRVETSAFEDGLWKYCKVHGDNNVSIRMLKLCDMAMGKYLVMIFKSYIEKGYFLLGCSKANVVLIYTKISKLWSITKSHHLSLLHWQWSMKAL